MFNALEKVVINNGTSNIQKNTGNAKFSKKKK